MAKDFKKGDDYLLYLNTGTYASPTWVLISAVSGLGLDEAPADVVVPEAGFNDGHLKGYGDPVITGTLYNDKGNSNVGTIITAMRAGTLKEFALADGPIATTGTKYFRLEACITGFPLSAERGEPASWSIELKRHANSDNDISYNTAA